MSGSVVSRGRVLVVLHEAPMGGASLAVLRCVPGLRERGWDFSFWMPPGPAAEQLVARGEQVAGLPRPIVYSMVAMRLDPGPWARARATPGYLRAFRRELRNQRPALVHANSHVTLADAIVARRAGVPTVIHIHEMFGEGRKWDLGRRLVARYGTEVVAVSDACADALAAPGRRPRVVRNGVELPPPPGPRPPERPFTVGTVAAIARRKGIDVLVDAVRRVHEQAPEIRFELIGAASDPLDAEWAADVLAQAAEHGIAHRERADVAAAMSGWDAFLLPSRRDPFPLSMLEAMAHGLPAIATAADGLREQVSAETGTLVEPEDAAGLAEAVLALAATPQAEREAIGAAARARVAAEFTIERQVDELDAVYTAALAAGRR